MKKYSLLLRYLEEFPFAEMFMQGHIRLNCLSFFWGGHDDPTKEGQIDEKEGLVCDFNAKSVGDCSRSDGYMYCNLLCCSKLDFVRVGDSIGWYTTENMEKFGDFVVIIKDPVEFEKRLVKAAATDGFKCGCNCVDYSDRVSGDRDCFDKEEKYAYQNEWRAALYRGVKNCAPCTLDIGPIYDIAEICASKALNRRLERIFRKGEFVPLERKYFGNIDRSELRQLFNNLGLA